MAKAQLAELREENRTLRLQVNELLQKLNAFLDKQGVSGPDAPAAPAPIIYGAKAPHKVKERVKSINASVAASSTTALSSMRNPVGSPTPSTMNSNPSLEGWKEGHSKKKRKSLLHLQLQRSKLQRA